MLAAIERSHVALVVLDVGGVVQRWNAGAERLFGWSAASAVGRHWADVGVVTDPVRRRRAADVLASALTSATSVSGDWVARRADGTTVRVHTVHERVLDPGADDGKPLGIVLLSFDLSHQERFEAALVREALHDRLTGLPMRSLVHHELAQRIAACAAGTEPGAAVLFVDLDGFKAVNDTHGHDVGDRVLVEVARRLRSAVRADDVVARVGGDEFVVVVPLRVDDSLSEVAGRVSASLVPAVEAGDGVSVDVTASIGAVQAGADDDPAGVLRRADAAMYRAKESASRARS